MVHNNWIVGARAKRKRFVEWGLWRPRLNAVEQEAAERAALLLGADASAAGPAASRHTLPDRAHVPDAHVLVGVGDNLQQHHHARRLFEDWFQLLLRLANGVCVGLGQGVTTILERV